MSVVLFCDLDHLSALRKKMILSDKPIMCVCLYTYGYCHTASRSSSHLHISWHIFPANLFTKIARIETTVLRVTGLFMAASALLK